MMNYWLRRIFRRHVTEAQLDSELRFHLAERSAELMAGGATSEEARRQAQIEFGGTEAIKQQCRESRRVHFLEVLVQDLSYGLRMLRRNPGFSLVAIVTLALGIGANTAIFSVVNGVLLNPLPFSQPNQLVTLYESKPHFHQGAIPYLNLLDWQTTNHTFSSIAGFRGMGFSLTGLAEPEFINAEMVSAGFFSTLGVKPVLGRLFTPQEDTFGGPPMVLITEGFWKRKFESSPSVLDRHLTLDGRDYQIIGVVPGVHLPIQNFNSTAEIFSPLGQWDRPENRDRNYALGINAIGRLRAGVTLEQARADMDAITHSLAQAFPQANAGTGATLVSLKEQMIGRVRPFLLMLLAAVCFVLLIACINVANLLLARSTTRRHEFAIRTSLGASQARMLRQLLTESTLLALLGGGVGLAFALWGTRAALHLVPFSLPRAEDVHVDWHVLLFSTLISVFAGMLFGVIPGLKSSQPNLGSGIKDSNRSVTGSGYRTNRIFVAAEMGMALVLLIGAGLMLRSMQSLWAVNPGFDARNVIGFGVAIPSLATTHDASTTRAGLRQLHQQVSSMPGVEAASLSWGALPFAQDSEEQFWIEGQPRPANDNALGWALQYVIEPEYFELMKVPLKRGRLFTTADDERAQKVVIIDERFAQKYFPGEDPVDRYLNFHTMAGRWRIVGVVGHVNQWGLDKDATQTLQAQLYIPYMQLPDQAVSLANTGTTMLMRTRGPAETTYEAIRHALARSSSADILFGAQTMDDAIAQSVAQRRFSMILLGSFALLAALLAAIGIYGVVSYVVGQRTREIGIRMALGARRGHVLAIVFSQGAKMTLLGMAAGLLAAFALTRLMAQLLFGVSPTDPVTFLAVPGILGLVALLACYIPARRAARVDPTVTLRYE